MKIRYIGTRRWIELSDAEILRKKDVRDAMRSVGEALLPGGPSIDWWRFEQAAEPRSQVRSQSTKGRMVEPSLRAIHLQLWDHGRRADREWVAWARSQSEALTLKNTFQRYASKEHGSLNQHLMDVEHLWPFEINMTLQEGEGKIHDVGNRTAEGKAHDLELVGLQIGAVKTQGKSGHGYTFFYPHHQTPGAMVLLMDHPFADAMHAVEWHAIGAQAFAKLTHYVDVEVTSQLLETLSIRPGLAKASPARVLPLLRLIAVLRERESTISEMPLTANEWRGLLDRVISEARAFRLGDRFEMIHGGNPEAGSKDKRLKECQDLALNCLDKLSLKLNTWNDFPALLRRDQGLVQAVLSEALSNAVRFHDHKSRSDEFDVSVERANKEHGGAVVILSKTAPQLAVWPESYTPLWDALEDKGKGSDFDPLARLEHGGVGQVIYGLAQKNLEKYSIWLGPETTKGTQKKLYKFRLEWPVVSL